MKWESAVVLVVYFFIIVTDVTHEQLIQVRNKFNSQPLRAHKSVHIQNVNICWVYFSKHKINNL